MVAPSAIVKLTAKTAMKGKFVKCVVAATIIVFASLIVIYTLSLAAMVFGEFAYAFLLTVAMLLIIAPLLLGAFHFFRRMYDNAEDSLIVIFHYFSSRELYSRALKLVGLIFLKSLLLYVIFLVPYGITELLASSFLYDTLNISMPVFASNLWVLSAFFKVIADIAVLFLMLRYYLAPFLFVSDEEMDAAECIHMSSVISKRTVFDFIFLIFSFLGWIILSLFMMPIIFTLPYFIISYIVHGKFAVSQYNRVVDNYNNADNYYSAEGI